MLDLLAVATTAGVIGYVLGGGKTEVRHRLEYQYPFDSQRWAVYMVGTDDPSKYKAVYEDRGRVKYTATGNGLSNTLEKLADKIGEK